MFLNHLFTEQSYNLAHILRKEGTFFSFCFHDYLLSRVYEAGLCLYPECMFPEYTIPANVIIPNVSFPNSIQWIPLPKGVSWIPV